MKNLTLEINIISKQRENLLDLEKLNTAPKIGDFPLSSKFEKVATSIPTLRIIRGVEKISPKWIAIDGFEEESKKRCGWVYIIARNDKIVSIGQTGDSLYGRWLSYGCGEESYNEKNSGRNANMMFAQEKFGGCWDFYAKKCEPTTYLCPIDEITKILIEGGVKETEKLVRNVFEKQFGEIPYLDLTDSALKDNLICKLSNVPDKQFTIEEFASSNIISKSKASLILKKKVKLNELKDCGGKPKKYIRCI